MALGRTHPTPRGQHDGDRFVGNERGFVDGLGGFALDDLRASRITVFFGVGGKFVADEFAQTLLVAEDGLELIALLGELFLLAANLHLFELGKMTELGLEDGFGLLFAQLEALHEHRLRLILATDDADHLIEIEIRDEQAIEDV